MDHVLEQVTATSHYNSCVRCFLKTLGSSFDEELTALLCSDTSEIGDDLLVGTTMSLHVEHFLAHWLNGIVHCDTLPWILMIEVDHNLASQF